LTSARDHGHFSLVVLILLNGLFAMSEIALVTARRARLARLAEDGDRAAAIAVRLGEEPNRFLSTIQIGIVTLSDVIESVTGELLPQSTEESWAV
jgi:putative hemolysin